VRAALAVAAACAAVSPTIGAALEPRYDHRDQQGPTIEALYLKDVIWRSSSESSSTDRGALRLSWGFDPTGDGNELLFGASWAALDGSDSEEERVLLTVDARYRACVGIDQFKTLLEVGIWGSAIDSFSVGPVVGLGFIYDFSRNVGLFATGSLAASIGEVRVVTFGGGLGLQLRYE
jgi:hypothetical protein